jgi:hypothetical protein
MATFDVVPTDPADPNRPFSAFGRCDVVGLRYGPRMLQFAPELADRDVIIVPGMEHACDSDLSTWQGVYSELYALWQTDAGELLREGDEFVVMGPGWRFVVSGVHVLPRARSGSTGTGSTAAATSGVDARGLSARGSSPRPGALPHAFRVRMHAGGST